jgi:hypothetical protein
MSIEVMMDSRDLHVKKGAKMGCSAIVCIAKQKGELVDPTSFS